MNTNNNNKVTITGTINEPFEFSHKVFSEKFYSTKVAVLRVSGVEDLIPVMVSQYLLDMAVDHTGKEVLIHGQFRSYNEHENNRTRLILNVFALEISFMHQEEMIHPNKNNCVELDGYLCKQPTYRESLSARKISDLFLAVNREYGTDYIPAIAWGRNALSAKQMKIGTHLKVSGRIQSRDYIKKIDDDQQLTKTAYEVSVAKMLWLPE